MNIRTDKWIDKSDWGDGPWQDEPDRVDWTDPTTGLPCLALRANAHFGNWCGYVAVPPGHALHGADYDHVDVDVHGSLTYAGPCMAHEGPQRERVCHVPAPGEPDDVWWFGFDCAHYYDLVPGMAALHREIGLPPLGGRHVYRDLDYVRCAVTRLAQQLAAAGTTSPRR